MDVTLLRAEDCRFAVLKALCDRAEGAHSAESLRTIYMRGHDFSQTEVDAALNLLATSELVIRLDNPSPSVGHRWQGTMKGLQAYARR